MKKAAAISSRPSPREPRVEPASLEGPITTGEISRAADPRDVDLAAIDYVEEEFFASGVATAYTADEELAMTGNWTVTPSETAPYKTRLYVRRPSSSTRFNGTVVVEWLNVSSLEAAPDWAYTGRALIDRGAAWVGVSAQAFGVVGGTPALPTGTPHATANMGLRGSNPTRYGSLDHPGDRYAFDIYSQISAALRSPGSIAVLGRSKSWRIIAAGESQSAGFLTTYINAVQPLANAYDGFFVHSRGAGAAKLDGSRGMRGSTTAYRMRTDLDVPIMVFETETDVGPIMRFGAARQPDTDLLRIWEAAGTAHADSFLVGPTFAPCPSGINDGPQHYVATAAMAALLSWVEDARQPPSGTPIETTGDGTTIVRDERGIACGGIRTPSVDVPVSSLTGEAPTGAAPLCALFGSSPPFDAASLSSLYPTKERYLAQFDEALGSAVKKGFVREADREMYAAEARAVALPG